MNKQVPREVRTVSKQRLIPEGEVADIEREAFGRGVALALSLKLADGWDQGFQAACDETPADFAPAGPFDEQNPYRTAVER